MAKPPRIPSYSLHKPSGRAVVKIKQRSYYLGEHGSESSHEAYAKIIADLLAGRPIHGSTVSEKGNRTLVLSITVGELIERFQRHADGYYVKNGKRTSEPASIRCALHYVPDSLRLICASEFTIGMLKTTRQAMIDAGLIGETPGTQASFFFCLSSIWKFSATATPSCCQADTISCAGIMRRLPLSQELSVDSRYSMPSFSTMLDS